MEMQLLSHCFQKHIFPCERPFVGFTGCGIGDCKTFPLQKRKEMEKESTVGMENVAAKSRKTKNEDHLLFLRKDTTKFPFESFIGG